MKDSENIPEIGCGLVFNCGEQHMIRTDSNELQK